MRLIRVMVVLSVPWCSDPTCSARLRVRDRGCHTGSALVC